MTQVGQLSPSPTASGPDSPRLQPTVIYVKTSYSTSNTRSNTTQNEKIALKFFSSLTTHTASECASSFFFTAPSHAPVQLSRVETAWFWAFGRSCSLRPMRYCMGSRRGPRLRAPDGGSPALTHSPLQCAHPLGIGSSHLKTALYSHQSVAPVAAP